MRTGMSALFGEKETAPSSAKAADMAAFAVSASLARPTLTISHIRRISTVARRAFSTDAPRNSDVETRTTSAPINLMKAYIAPTGITVTARASPRSVVFMEAFIITIQQHKKKKSSGVVL